MPYLRGLDSADSDGADPSAVLGAVQDAIETVLPARSSGTPGAPSPAPGRANAADQPWLVMRQQLFCNASLAHVMFELTNALLELGVPTVPQDEHSILSKDFVHREEDLFQAGAPEKYARIAGCLGRDYDPEKAVTVHFSMLKSGARCSAFGVFSSLTPREVLYTTGNHTIGQGRLRLLTDRFERILAPSWHVLRPYLEAGLSANRGSVIPHGIDPGAFNPQAPPLPYRTAKRFRFLQTSFPWVYEKGFDLTIKAFCPRLLLERRRRSHPANAAHQGPQRAGTGVWQAPGG